MTYQINNEDAIVHIYDVSVNILTETFYYKLSTNDITDISNIHYYVDKTKWNNISTNINPHNSSLHSGGFINNDTIGEDIIRHIANQCFGTHLVANIFTNESTLYNDVIQNCINVSTDIETKISAIDISDGIISGMMVDASGNKYMDYTFDGSNNLSKIMFDSLYDLSAGRFAKDEDKYAEKGDLFYKMPFLPNDEISFKLTICPHIDTFTAIPVPQSGEQISERIYKCVMKMAL